MTTCYGRVTTRTGAQEWYETASKDAAQRTRELKKLGFKAFSQAMGPQVTGVGTVKMTLVTVLGENVPQPARIEKI